MAQVMKPQGARRRRPSCPYASERSSYCVGAVRRVHRRTRGRRGRLGIQQHVPRDISDDGVGDRDGSPPGLGRWRAGDQRAVREPLHRSHDTHRAVEEVDISAPESGQLAETQAGKGGQQHERSVPLPHRLGQRHHLRNGCHRPLRARLHVDDGGALSIARHRQGAADQQSGTVDHRMRRWSDAS